MLLCRKSKKAVQHREFTFGIAQSTSWSDSVLDDFVRQILLLKQTIYSPISSRTTDLKIKLDAPRLLQRLNNKLD